jgi:hypothetical protein
MSNVAVQELGTKNPVVSFTSINDTDLAFSLLVLIVVVDVVSRLLLVPDAADVEENIGHYTLLCAVNHVARLFVDGVATCVSSEQLSEVVEPLSGHVVAVCARIRKDFVIGGSYRIVNSCTFGINKPNAIDV